MKLTLLGTSCMVPTKTRNVSGMYLNFDGRGILFDCGEGTQRQMSIAGINRNAISIICISHWHADHVAGLTGLLQTINTKESVKKLLIIGPVETKKRLQHLIDATYCDMTLDMTIVEVDSTPIPITVHDDETFYIQAASLSHGIPCVGYSFIEKERYKIALAKLKKDSIPSGPHLKKLQQGKSSTYNGIKLAVSEYTTIVPEKKFTYVGDTKECESAYLLAKNANLFVCESTYLANQADQAKKYNHMTCVQAATIAKDVGVKRLVLTHISQRYSESTELLAQAKEVFDNVIVGEDFLVEKI